MRVEYVLLLLMPVLITSGQLLLKKNTGRIIVGRGLADFFKSLVSPGIIGGIAAVASAPLLYIAALGEVRLSEAFAFNSLNYVLIFVSGHFILKERVNAWQIIGIVLISAGFILPFAAGRL